MDPKQHAAEVSVVFEKLVESITRVTKEEMSQPAFAGLGSLSHPDLHDVSNQLRGRVLLDSLIVFCVLSERPFFSCDFLGYFLSSFWVVLLYERVSIF